MHRRYLSYIICPLTFSAAFLMMLTACKDADDTLAGGGQAEPANIIRVGGISTDVLVASVLTRGTDDTDPEEEVDETTVMTTPAENVDWLREPLFSGLDITFGKTGVSSTSRVAVLKLLPDASGPNGVKYSEEGLAEYSFFYRDDETGNETTLPALWCDNGSHFFEGLYVPGEIKYDASTQTVAHVNDGTSGTAPNLVIDQHTDATTPGALGNYTLLSHYLGMPSNFTLNATVARVTLPFRHRLSRVIAYILIDPTLGDVKISGYSLVDGKDDPTTTKIFFNNVGVLAGVKDEYDEVKKHHAYTPQWTQARKVTPHFVGERGSYNDSINQVMDGEHFIAYYNETKKTYIYPTDRLWETIHGQTFTNDETTYQGTKYTRTIYGRVPVYDLIVQPTYTSLNNVMYDEENVDNPTAKERLYVATNQIDFELTLDNGLHYTKKFPFDLDANYQTVVYLHISRERVDYNSSGSDLWQEAIGYDDYYGVNNQNGNTLSYAGSSWQRAYTNSETQYNVTDGHLYRHDSEDEYAQYVTAASWKEMFAKAYKGEGGIYHGDYFILAEDITIDTDALPEDFVFTGHLDGQDHTITLIGNRGYLFNGLNGNYLTPQEPGHAESDATKPWEANVHKEKYGSTEYWVPYRCDDDGWRAEIINTKVTGGTFFKPANGTFTPSVTGYVHNCWEYKNERWERATDYTPSIPQYN